MLVIAEGLTVLGLVFGAEMTAARFLTVQGISNDELGKFKIIFKATSLLQLGVEFVGRARNEDAFPKLFFQFGNQLLCF